MPGAGRKRREIAPSVAALATNVARTAETAATVLAHFKTTLHQSGMAGGLEAYRLMTDTLINQRLWALGHDPASGEEHFKAIAADARAIHELLTSYAELMAKLALLPQMTGPGRDAQPAAATVSSDPGDQLHAWLLQQPRPVSATRIRAALHLSSVALETQLRQLEAAGRVVKSGSAGRYLFAARAAS